MGHMMTCSGESCGEAVVTSWLVLCNTQRVAKVSILREVELLKNTPQPGK